MENATVTDGAAEEPRTPAADPLVLRARLILGPNHRYEPVRVLGAGGMGVVLEAKDAWLARVVALKLVRPRDGDADGGARLRREAQAMAQLAHPNVATVFDVDVIEDQVFIAMELVAGGTLRDRVGSAHAWRDQVRLLVGAGRGLAAAHAAGIVHRDFKPDNVLVGEDGRARVTDFGLAFADDAATSQIVAPPSITQTGAVAGTVPYLAPERLHEVADACADQFAFAVTAFELLEGRRPFDSSDLEKHVASVRAGRRAWGHTRASKRLRQVVDRGLSAEPSARWPSLSAMLDALERATRSRLPWIGAVTLLVIAACAVFVIGRRSEAPPPAPKRWEPALLVRETAATPVLDAALSRDGKTIITVMEEELWTQVRGSSARTSIPLPSGGKVVGIWSDPTTSGVFAKLAMKGSAAGRAELWRLDLAGGQHRRIAEIGSPTELVPSRDGRRLLISSSNAFGGQPPGVAVMDAETGALRQLIPPDTSLHLRASWSPDERRAVCVRLAGDARTMLVIDIETGSYRAVPDPIVEPHNINGIAWAAADRWIVTVTFIGTSGGAGLGYRSVLEEWHLNDELGVVERHEIFGLPEYGTIFLAALTEDHALLSTMSGERRSGLIDLSRAAPSEPSILATGSLSDALLAGWTASGELVLPANTNGTFDVIGVRPGSKPRMLVDTPDDERPVLVIGETIWLTSKSNERCVVKKLSAGRLEIVDGLPCGTFACAGDRQPPCLFSTDASGPTTNKQPVRTYRWWDPATGKLGAEALTIAWPLRLSDEGLSVDGTELAVGRREGPSVGPHVELFDLKRGGSRRIGEIESGYYQFVSYGPDGRLYATRLTDQHEVVRFDSSGPTILIRQWRHWLTNPRVSHDERNLAVTITDMRRKFWIVNRR